ncbi:acetate kinase [Allomesorhizobium alhagi]|uniref:Acetate kinase n=1 Tax=Mesorhizobium alhagi CCNWXJ12-2 TaxID=1107882 RepID=H0I3E7_9HYPH|nr:acetate kinase [Mesorhizobium alhagi]EHK52497.1 acetate kinase [Mesorhizobium alhagi CCNWXJ12-2]
MTAAILVLNAGSSSLKFAVFERREGLPLIFKGSVSSLRANPRLKLSTGNAAEEKSLGRKSLDIGAAVEVVAAEMGDRGSGHARGGGRAQDRSRRAGLHLSGGA